MNELNKNKESIDLKEKDTIQPLSQRKKYALIIVFLLGIPLSYITVLPLGLLCSAILLFQENKKANKLAYFLLILQILIILIMSLIWSSII